MIYPEVRGWLTRAEAAALHALARGRTVLEIGSFCGLSTICLAQSALSVHVVDPFDAAGITPEDTYGEFLANLKRYGVGDKTVIHRGLSADVLPTLRGDFGLIFVDGAHDEANVRRDLELSLLLLSAGSWLAFHDYGEPAWPAVARVVDAWRDKRRFEVVDRLAILQL